MKFDMSGMSAQVYTKTDKGVYYVKVDFPEMGLFINSITVRVSAKYPERGPWVQMPMVPGIWKKVIEMRNDSPIKQYIEEEVLRAYEDYRRGEDAVVSDIDGVDISKQLEKAWPSS